MKKWARAIAWGLEWASRQLFKAAGWVLVLYCFMIGGDIAYRLVANRSIPGVFEIGGVMLLLLICLSFAYIELEHKHVVVDILSSHFRGKLAQISQLLNSLFQVGFFLAMGWFSWLNCLRAWVCHDMGVGMVPVPQVIPWGGLTLTSFLVVAVLIMGFVRSVARN